jgi:hypothetical protein
LKYPQYWKVGLKYLLKALSGDKVLKYPGEMLERWSEVLYLLKLLYQKEGSEVPTPLVRWSEVIIVALILERRF